MRSWIASVLFVSLVAGCTADTEPATRTAPPDVSSPPKLSGDPVIFSTDYGLGIVNGATNGPDRHPADVDDAYAVTLAVQSTAVQAIVTTFGNDKARPSAESARRGLSALGFLNPAGMVSVGSEGFLDAAPVSFVPEGPPVPVFCVNQGVERMRDVLDRTSPEIVTLFAIGPFTDIACLLRAYPDSFKRLKEIIALVGSFDGKPVLEGKSVADFNFAMDPTALGEVIVQREVPLTLIMFEVSQKGAITNATLNTWKTRSTGARKYYGRATLPHAQYWDRIFKKTDGQALFDAHTVYYFLNRYAYSCEDDMVAVATVGGYPDMSAPPTKNFFTVSLQAEGADPLKRGVKETRAGYVYTGAVRGCYAFASTDGTQKFVQAVEASVKSPFGD